MIPDKQAQLRVSICMLMMMMMLLLIMVGCPCLLAIAYNNGGGGFEALFVFGDSLLDVGNRRQLKPHPNGLQSPVIDADHPPYGRDFPSHVPTGRFSNGLIGSDILASFMGLPYPPPYLQDRTNIMKGCSFATSGAKIRDKISSYQFPRLNFVDQVHLFAEVQQQLVLRLGDVQASNLISQSLFLTSLGANDYLSDYFSNPVQQIKIPKEDFRQTLVSSYSEYVQILYSLGARKFAVVSLPPLGCIPTLEILAQHDDNGCVSFVNEEVKSFNLVLLQMSIQLQATHPDAHFVFLNSFDISLDAATNPIDYGFSYGLRPCCTNDRDRVVPICIEGISSICKNASEHVFWDFAHPSEALNFILARSYWGGSPPNVNPINLQELAGL